MVIDNYKSVGILFRSKRFALSCMPNCRISNIKVIKVSSSVKYLGVCINDTITENEDIKRQMKYLYETAYYLNTDFQACPWDIFFCSIPSHFIIVHACPIPSHGISIKIQLIKANKFMKI